MAQQSLNRYPVSPARQRIGSTVLALLCIGLVFYYLSTRDEAIRRQAVAYLQQMTSGEVSVGRASFSMFGGITLHNVRVSTPYDARLGPRADDDSAREVFAAGSLKLIHSPWRLLLGSLRIEEIVAVQPRIKLVHHVDTDLRNWQLLFRDTTSARRGGPSRRPTITVRSARVVVVSVDAAGGSEAEFEELDADVRPHTHLRSAFQIELRRLTEPSERTTVILDPGNRLLANTPFVRTDTIRLQLPRPYRLFFRRIGLQGEVKLTRLTFGDEPAGQRESAIELRGVRCDIPLSMWRSGVPAGAGARHEPTTGPADGGAIHLSEVRGAMSLTGARLQVDLFGLVNGAHGRITGSLDGIDGPLDELGLTLRVACEGLPMPEGALRRRLTTDPAVPRDLRDFFSDYDPRGRFDVDCRLERPSGAAAGTSFLGVIEPRGANASYRGFPYRVRDLGGVVRFERDGVRIEDVRGRHGSATVALNGFVDRTTGYAGVDLSITATTMPLDDELLAALPERYRDVWRRFAPTGTADATISLSRPGSDADKPAWRTRVDAELRNATATFEAFPYPLEGVRGRIEVDSDEMRMWGVTGRRGGASVRVDGDARVGAGGPPSVELHVEGRSIPLDDALANALPPEGRAAFEQFRPGGLVDVTGTVARRDGNDELAYDLFAELRDARVKYQPFPIPIEDVQGTIRLRPDRVSVVDVRGRRGDSRLSARGEVRRTGDSAAADLLIECRDAVLDESLREALPATLRGAWDLLQPSGLVTVTTRLHRSNEGRGPRFRHCTLVEARAAAVRLRGFPIDLTDVEARAVVTDRAVEIESLRGRYGDGTMELRGTIDLTAPGRCGTFTVDARGIAIDERLVAALPPRVRRVAEPMKPAGVVEAHLDMLRVETTPDGRSRWDFAGRAEFRDARMTGGVRLEDVQGALTGHGAVGPDGSLILDATAELQRLRLGGWHLENGSARLVYNPASRTLHIDDAAADAYGGMASGLAEVRFGGPSSTYQASITVRDAQLADYLARRRGRTKDESADAELAEGLVYGNLMLRGTTGPRAHRQGAGEVTIREAQVWKLPLVWALFQVLNLTPDENVFHDCWVKYYLSDDALTLHRIDMQGKAMSFVGGGRMDLRTGGLDVTLLAGSPMRVRIPFLTEILENASRELMEVRITGTPAEPRIEPQPMRSLRVALETLFPEAPARRE